MSFVHRNPLTARELAARRQNARRSSGPRTRPGKARVRLNALKHGRRSMRFRRFLTTLHVRTRGFYRFSDSIRIPGEAISPLERVLTKHWRLREHAQAWEAEKAGAGDEQSGEVL